MYLTTCLGFWNLDPCNWSLCLTTSTGVTTASCAAVATAPPMAWTWWPSFSNDFFTNCMNQSYCSLCSKQQYKKKLTDLICRKVYCVRRNCSANNRWNTSIQAWDSFFGCNRSKSIDNICVNWLSWLNCLHSSFYLRIRAIARNGYYFGRLPSWLSGWDVPCLQGTCKDVPLIRRWPRQSLE